MTRNTSKTTTSTTATATEADYGEPYTEPQLDGPMYCEHGRTADACEDCAYDAAVAAGKVAPSMPRVGNAVTVEADVRGEPQVSERG